MLSRWLNIAGSVHLDASKNGLDYNILSKWIRLSSPFHIFLARILGDTNEEYSRFHVICAWVQFAWSQLCSHYSPPGYLCSSHWKAKQNKTKKKNNKHRQDSRTITIFAIIDERLPKTFCGFPLTFSDLSQFFFLTDEWMLAIIESIWWVLRNWAKNQFGLFEVVLVNSVYHANWWGHRFSSVLLKNNKRTCLLQCSLPSAKGFDKVKLAPRKKMVTMLLFMTIAISALKDIVEFHQYQTRSSSDPRFELKNPSAAFPFYIIYTSY